MKVRKEEWFNDGEFWGRFAPVMFDGPRWAEAPAVADGVTALARLKLYRAEEAGAKASEAGDPGVTAGGPGAAAPRCLDLCCGFGRIGLELARRGFSVTGVDITESYLRAAREDRDREGLDAEFILEDVRSFKRPGAFDLAINLYNSFGYFEDPRDDALMVRNAWESLKPGGTLMIETLGKELVVRDFVKGEWFERAGYYVLTRYESLDSWSALRNTWILIDQGNPGRGSGTIEQTGQTERTKGRITEKTFTHRLYAASELRRLLLDSGFSEVELYGDWDESPYDHRAGKLIALGRKGGAP
ncbi:MAG: class I SAM-dependent methyltransferase [Treponema sp.]|nr:class I SAM-dependent methyltransferase [Treponema sp.]